MQVQRGEHIKKGKGEVRLKEEAGGGAAQQRGVKKISKRNADFEDEYYTDEYEYEYDSEESEYEQGEEYYYYDEEEREGFPFQLLEEEEEEDDGVISFNDIETECPAGTICVETFFCAEFSGNSKSDQIVNEKPIPILSKIIFIPALFDHFGAIYGGFWDLLQPTPPESLSRSEEPAEARGETQQQKKRKKTQQQKRIKDTAAKKTQQQKKEKRHSSSFTSSKSISFSTVHLDPSVIPLMRNVPVTG